jgi:hypothetical protein
MVTQDAASSGKIIINTTNNITDFFIYSLLDQPLIFRIRLLRVVVKLTVSDKYAAYFSGVLKQAGSTISVDI